MIDYVAMGEQVKLDIRRDGQYQVDALLDAGWRFELPDLQDSEPWQWYWRAPAKRKGKGRKYLSTNQAFNALQSGNLTAHVGNSSVLRHLPRRDS